MADIWMDVDAALSEVPVNLLSLIDDTDFKAREEGVTYDQAGMDLVWNFVTPAGAFTQTAVVPTNAGVHDWANQGNGIYTIEIPAAGGTINNDTEGFGWFTGFATGVLPWRGPVIGFRAAGLNDALIETGTGIATAADVWDETLHGTKTAKQLLGILLPAFVAGKVTGGGTTTITWRDTEDGLNAIVATVDASGNRSAVTINFA